MGYFFPIPVLMLYIELDEDQNSSICNGGWRRGFL